MLEVKVTFQPASRSVCVLPGTLLTEAALRAGITLLQPCGGVGVCGKCRVRILQGDIKRESVCCDALSEDEMGGGWTLACQTKVQSDIIIDVPAESMMEHCHKILESDSGQNTFTIKPLNDSPDALGIAFDIGTTTVVGSLFSLAAGKEKGVMSRMNPQICYGDDVISRIHRIREKPETLNDMQTAIVDTINEILINLCEENDLTANDVHEISAAGNSTMQQILCGFDPSPLGEMPFKQAFQEAQLIRANDVGISANRDATLYVLPQIGGFIGGDTVAGMIATRIDSHEKPVLLVDIGTNGEIVLAAKDGIFATSTAAGPAFEGARISQGMRAVAGAIEKIIIDDYVMFNVIGNVKPSGLCGTALIDIAADLLDKGIIDETGLIVDREDAPAELPDSLRSRIVEKDEQAAFIIVHAEATSTGEPIFLTQRDVRELQLATGAIRAGINILLKNAGLSYTDLDAIFLAGAFGNFIRRNKACRIGLLPSIPHERIRFIGNAASLGAKFTLLSSDERDYAETIRKKATHVDLSLDTDFQMEFSEAMIFPVS